MLNRHEQKELVWIDLNEPTKDEVRAVIKEFGIPLAVGEELLSPTLKPKIDAHPEYLYLILHFPAIKHSHSNERNQEVDFIIGEKVLITAHYDTVDAIHKFGKVFEVNALLEKEQIGEHAGFLFFFLIKKLYKSLMHELEYTESTLVKIEEDIFQGKEKDMVESLSMQARELIDFEKTLSVHDEVLTMLDMEGRELFGDSFALYLRRIRAEYRRVWQALQNERQFLGELRATNDSLVSTKQNEVMKVLTIMAFVTFPLSLVAGIFGMNTSYIPIVGLPADFWIVIGIMAGLTILFFAFFKYKKWL